MERRRFKRLDTKISAKVTIDSKYYEGSIESLSEDGLFEIAFARIDVTDFNSGLILEVRFHIPSGEQLDLQCKVAWFRLGRDSIDRLIYIIGMEIISPHQKYAKLMQDI